MKLTIETTIKELSGEIEKLVDTFEGYHRTELTDYMVVMRHCLGFENKMILNEAKNATKDFHEAYNALEVCDDMELHNDFEIEIEMIQILLNAIDDLWTIKQNKPLSQQAMEVK